MRISEQKKEKLEAPKRTFTDIELEKFHQELQEFKISQKLRSGETVSYIDFDKYHESKGTMTPDKEVITRVDEFGDSNIPYERLEEKIRQYKNWCGRKEYSKNQKAIQLANLVEGLRVNLELD